MHMAASTWWTNPMTNGRQTTRSTPVEVKAGPDGDSFWATPLPWRKRNDLGNQINFVSYCVVIEFYNRLFCFQVCNKKVSLAI